MAKVKQTLASAKRLLIVVVLGVAAWGQAQASDGSTPLHASSSSNAFEKAQDLLDDGADVNARNNDRNTPLFMARNETKIVRLLLDHGGK